MGESWSRSIALGPLLFLFFVQASPLLAQEGDRIWGRVHTVGGDVHEGFIRWDLNEGGWADQLDGTKENKPVQFQDWWRLAHPDDAQRDRVIALAGYRITWDDDQPEFVSRHESGIRFGHISRLSVEEDKVSLTLRSGQIVELDGGATDLGRDLREIRVQPARGEDVELDWDDLRAVEFGAAPPDARATGLRLFGTVELHGGASFTGYIGWDVNQILTTDTLNGEDSGGRRREILFGDIMTIRPTGDGAEITVSGGERVELFGGDDVDDGNDGIQISDPGLGLVDVEWEEMKEARFHSPDVAADWNSFDGGRRLRGTVLTADSTEISGWILWDADEAYSWEMLDGNENDTTFDIEFGQIASIEKTYQVMTSVNVGPAGVSVNHPLTEGTKVTLLDGRVFELGGSNDVDENNDGVFVLEDGGGWSPDDEEAEWIMVRWEDFLAIHFEWGDRP